VLFVDKTETRAFGDTPPVRDRRVEVLINTRH